MQKNSKNFFVDVALKLLGLLFLAKALMLFLLLFLPQQSVAFFETKNYQPPFARFNMNAILDNPSLAPSTTQSSSNTSGNGAINITNIILKGLYGNEKRAVVIVATKSNPKKSELIGIGENFMGYVLKSVRLESALFEKDGQNYTLQLDKTTLTSQPQITQKHTFNPDIPVEIKKEEIAFYAKSPDQIWKDIAISEIKEGKKITGFKVTRINPSSRFAELGLQKGDVIIKANNVLLTSYQDAINIYQNIENLQSVQIVFLRNNQEKELIYEIR